jgi:hypothetical protein
MVLENMKALDTSNRNFFSNLEVYLHSLIDALRDYPSMDAQAVTLLQSYIDLASQPNPMPICVRRSFLKVFRSLITSPHKEGEFVYRVMCMAISCFEEPLLFTTAERTFYKACEENKHIATNIFTEFGPVLEKYPHRSYIVRGLITIVCQNEELMKQYLFKALDFLFGKF